MKEILKIIIRTVVAIVGIVAVGFGGCVGCFQYVGNSNRCSGPNIDNIELRTHIDIPAIVQGSTTCVYDKAKKTKTNYFKIRTDVMNMDRYAERNYFVPMKDTYMDLSVFDVFAVKPEITPDNLQHFYYNTGERKGTDWLAVVDKNSGGLWIFMKIKGLW